MLNKHPYLMKDYRPRLDETEYEIVKKIKQMSSEELNKLSNQLKSVEVAPSERKARILILDIENSPAEGYFWGLFKQNIGIDFVKNSNFIICWSAKWLFDEEMMSERLTPEEIRNMDDRRICHKLWELFNEADFIVAHNATKHDIPLSQTRFLVHQFPPNSPVRPIDTLIVAKKQFKFISNKLDFINRVLGLDVKIHTGGELWVSCMAGNEKSLQEMSLYCDNDVKILEEMYVRIRGWIKNHPNVGVFTELKNECCPNCGSHDISWKGRHKYSTNANLYPTGQCNGCGAWVRDRTTELSRAQRENLIISIAR